MQSASRPLALPLSAWVLPCVTLYVGALRDLGQSVPRSKLMSKDKGGDDKENGQGSEKAEKDEEKKKKRSKVSAVGPS